MHQYVMSVISWSYGQVPQRPTRRVAAQPVDSAPPPSASPRIDERGWRGRRGARSDCLRRGDMPDANGHDSLRRGAPPRGPSSGLTWRVTDRSARAGASPTSASRLAGDSGWAACRRRCRRGGRPSRRSQNLDDRSANGGSTIALLLSLERTSTVVLSELTIKMANSGMSPEDTAPRGPFASRFRIAGKTRAEAFVLSKALSSGQRRAKRGRRVAVPDPGPVQTTLHSGARQRAALAMVPCTRTSSSPTRSSTRSAGQPARGRPPSLHVAVSSLRKSLGDGDFLVTRAPGYVFRVTPTRSTRPFERLAENGRVQRRRLCRRPSGRAPPAGAFPLARPSSCASSWWIDSTGLTIAADPSRAGQKPPK